LMSVQNWTIRNSSFFNCSIYSISLGRLSGDPDPANVTIENNTMEPSDNFGVGDEQGYFTIVLDHVSTRFGNLRIRNNSLAQAIQVETMDVPDATGFDQTVIESNIMHGLQACAPTGMTAPTYRNNVLDGARCGTNPTMVSNAQTLFADRSGDWDFHLKAGGAAQGAASTVSGQFTPTDIGGKPRDAAPDAGAYEYGSGS